MPSVIEKLYRQYALVRNEQGLLSDDHLQVRYALLPELLGGLDRFFTHMGLKNACCIGMESSNRVETSVLLLYCLLAEINFYIAPAVLAEQASFPDFCDYILDFPAGNRQESGLMETLQMRANPAFQFPTPALPVLSSKVLFSSSGTSGARKYICFQGDHLLENARNCVERFQFQPRRNILLPLPVGHMYGMGVGLLPALLSGASIRLMEKSNLIKILDQIKQQPPDLTLLTPSLVRMVLLLNKAFLLPGRYVTAGERIEPESLERFTNQYAPLINLYGCTELGAIATTTTSLPLRSDHEALYPLGSVEIDIDGDVYGPLKCRHPAGFSFYVDRKGQKLPGDYLGETWFYTKDVAEKRKEGFFIRGRLDNAINRAGFLFSLEEVETKILEKFGSLKTVIVFEVEQRGRALGRLIAFYETGPSPVLSEAELTAWCKKNLNKYLVPDEFHLVENLPRLYNGKPDRLTLIDSFKSQLTAKNFPL